MKKNVLIIIVVVTIVILLAGYFIWSAMSGSKFFGNNINSNNLAEETMIFDPLNATYTIDGQQFTLKDGKAEKDIPGSASKIKIFNFEIPFYGDLNGDGIDDAVLTLVYTTGGSGTFYYIVAAINTDQGAVGTNAILLGDRIAPQNALIEDETIVANYADRGPNEPMTEEPSIGITKRIFWDGNNLVEKKGK
jgi:hypothetical protein